ncbi:MAG: GYF domain-containing protein [Hyphomicrobiaceae bacterium]
MSGSNAKVEWYLARDGQQHGPLSEPELKKFIELGHLNATDLVWRAGFPEWRTASEVFPETKPEASGAAAKQDSQQRPLGGIENARAESKREEPAWVKAAEPSTRAGIAGEGEKADRVDSAAPGAVPVGQFGKAAAPDSPSQQAPTSTADTDVQTMQSVSSDVHPAQAKAGLPSGSDWSVRRRPPSRPETQPVGARSTTTGPTAERRTSASPAAPQPSGPSSTSAAAPGRQASSAGSSTERPHARAETTRSAPPVDEFDDDDFYDDYGPPRRRRPIVAAVMGLLIVGLFGAGGWLAYANQDTIAKIIGDLTEEQVASNETSVVAAPDKPARTAVEQKVSNAAQSVSSARTLGAETTRTPQAQPPPKAAAVQNARLDFLNSKMWQTFEREYPDWARKHETSASKLSSEGKSSDEVLAYLVGSVVQWRRANADKVLTAPPDNLRSLAKTFVANLRLLVQKDVQACYGFISKGELSPQVLPLFKDKQVAPVLGTQTEAIIAAAQSAGSAQTTYLSPSPPDFNKLARLLIKRGWTEADLKMFSDPAALSSAPADKVCKLVTEWFDTQLQMPAGEQQMRLLATSLQPVVRG